MRKKVFLAAVVALAAMGILLLIASQSNPELRRRLDEGIRHANFRLDWAMDHVKGPWNPFAKKVSLCAPFDAVRWRDSVPEGRVKGTWYELLAVDDVSTKQIVLFCKNTYGRIWRKRFEEDLVLVLQGMGKEGYANGETGSLTVRRLDTGETLVLTNVAWTNANRETLLRTALDAWIANGREKDSRDDPTMEK
jgi:hypothetical protein